MVTYLFFLLHLIVHLFQPVYAHRSAGISNMEMQFLPLLVSLFIPQQQHNTHQKDLILGKIYGKIDRKASNLHFHSLDIIVSYTVKSHVYIMIQVI